MSEVETGGCLCGHVRYQLNRDAVISTHHCHCQDCQKSTGSGFSTIVMVMDDAFTLSQGEVKTFSKAGDSGSDVSRSFCPDCGSPIYSATSMAPGLKMIKAGSLDNSDWLQPVSGFWASSARCWAPVNKDIPMSDANP